MPSNLMTFFCASRTVGPTSLARSQPSPKEVGAQWQSLAVSSVMNVSAFDQLELRPSAMQKNSSQFSSLSVQTSIASTLPAEIACVAPPLPFFSSAMRLRQPTFLRPVLSQSKEVG